MAAEVEIVFNGTDNTGGAFGGILSNFGNLGNIVTGIKSAFDLVGGAIDATVGLFTPFIDSASESEQAVARLEGVLRATSGAAGLSSQQLQDMANSLQNTTRFSDETVLAGEALLLTFRNITGETFERTVPAMVDMAEIFGSVDSAAMQLGKALNDPVAGLGALSRAGIQFSDEQKEMIKNFMETGDVAAAQNIILTEVEKQVKGLAETMGGTFAGQIDIAKNKLDTLRELIGGPLIMILGDLLGKFMDMAQANPVLQTITGFFELLNTNLNSGILTPLESVAFALRGMSEAAPWFEDLANSLILMQNAINSGTSPFVALKEQLDALAGGETPLANIAQAISDFIQRGETEGWGPAIVGTINDALIAVDWTPVTDILSKVFSGAITLSLNSLDVVIKNVDWGVVANSLFEGLVSVFTGIIDQGADALIQGLANIFSGGNISQFQDSFKNIGVSIVDGLKAGVEWAWGNFKALFGFGFDDIIAFIKAKLGIASASTVFKEITINIVQGLIDGWNALFTTFKNLISSGVDAILQLFAPFLALFGVSVPTGGTTTGGATGTFGGFGTGSTTGGTTPASGYTIIHNNYGTVYYGYTNAAGDYDCPSPHPLVASSGNQLVTTGF